MQQPNDLIRNPEEPLDHFLDRFKLRYQYTKRGTTTNPQSREGSHSNLFGQALKRIQKSKLAGEERSRCQRRNIANNKKVKD